MLLKKNLLVFYSLVFFISNGYSQLEKGACQVGVSVLPVFDVFKLFPKNEIKGFASTANLGFFAVKNLSFGINPYYAEASNSYATLAYYGAGRGTQKNKVFGLNANSRYYFISKEKILTYLSLSLGFGNMEQKTTNRTSLLFIEESHTNKSIFTFLGSVGVNYFVVKNLAIELNVAYLNINFISTNPTDKNFQTIVPALGLQFFWN